VNSVLLCGEFGFFFLMGESNLGKSHFGILGGGGN
jgi:hypothetical protein